MFKPIKQLLLITFILLYTTFSNFSIVFGKDSIYSSYDLGFPTVSNNIVILDKNSKVLLYEKNGFQKIYPASTTKIMTALLLLENTENLDTEIIYFTSEALDNLEVDASTAGMNVGDSLSAKDCLYALLLPSANEVANAIALHLSDSIEDFGIKMTTRAKELGCENTNFTNPSGLHNDNHYTTAYDIALIMAEISNYDDFIDISKTEVYDIPPTETEEKVRTINNSNKLITTSSAFYDETVEASKTGYTSKAEYTLVTYGEEEKKEIIVSTMYSTNYDRFEDTSNLLKFAYSNYINITLDSIVEPIFFDNLSKKMFAEIKIDDITLNLPNKLTKNMLTFTTTMDTNLVSPIHRGDTIGKIETYYGDILLDSSDIISKEDITNFQNTDYSYGLNDLNYLNQNSFTSILIYLLIILLIVFLLIFIFFIYKYKVTKHNKYKYKLPKNSNIKDNK